MIRLAPLALVFVVGVARANLPPPGPPPDPSKGESYDGRARPGEPTARQIALAAPRAVLVLPRLALAIVRIPVLFALDYTDRRDALRRSTPVEPRPRSGLSPLVSGMSGSYPSIGARIWARDLFGPGRIDTAFSLETSGPTYFEGALVFAPNPALPVGVGLDLRAYRRTDTAFYGLAGDVPFDADGDDLRLRVEVRSLEASALATVRPGGAAGEWRGRLRVGAATRDFEEGYPGDGAEPGVTPGVREWTRFLRAAIAIDRIGPFDASRGLAGLDASVSLLGGVGIGGDDARWLSYVATAAYGVPTGGGAAILVSGLVGDQHSWGDDPVAFTERLSLGGARLHRGFRAGRFRGGSAILGAVDYRFPILMALDGFVFVENGGAFREHFDDFDLEGMRTSLGGGVQVFWGWSQLRLTIGWGLGDGPNFALSYESGL